MSRPKGYADWSPQAETLALVDQVKAVLREYADHLPLTVRQIFYRLVGQYGFDKTELAYKRLAGYIVRARRAQMIPFKAIRDDGTIDNKALAFGGLGDFWDEVADDADHYRRDRLADQPCRIELWCEAAGMVPQLFRVAGAFSIPVFSTGGFSSVTVTHEIAQRAMERDVPTVFLHVGDYDPSGESIFEAMSTDARSFLLQEVLWAADDHDAKVEELREHRRFIEGPELIAKRVALTEAQVEEHELPTAPPKSTDSRSASWIGETCQAEAMPPDLLAATVRDAIEAELDLPVLEALREEEEAERTELIEKIEEVRP